MDDYIVTDEDRELEFFDEWENRDPELRFMSPEEYNELRCIEEYGWTKEDMDTGDEDETWENWDD